MSQNGKGSSRRQSTKDERKRFEDNYEAIFGKPKKRKKAVVEKVEVVEMTPETQALADQLTDALRKFVPRDSEGPEKV